MPAALHPANEADRQRALEAYQVLDRKVDPVFDSIVRFAAELCDAPIGLLSLIDRDRQWFLARHGLDVEETPRIHSLCAHAILTDALTETPDARKDNRFCDSALVTGFPGIRFYAAHPITTREGFNIGTICVAAPAVKRLKPFQRWALKHLAMLVIMLLDSQKAAFEQEQQLRHMATHDNLTSLPNRVLGRDRLQTALARAHRNGTTLALLFIDLDNFKLINDTHGHAAGDELLSKIGRRLVAATRETDTVARWGGDEFVVILTDISNASDAESKRKEFLQALDSKYRIGDDSISVSASIGLAIYPNDGKTEKALLHHADRAMYGQKRKRRRP